jgi:hypothetical protein
MRPITYPGISQLHLQRKGIGNGHAGRADNAVEEQVMHSRELGRTANKSFWIFILVELCWLGRVTCCFAQPATAPSGEVSVYHVGNSLTGDLISEFPKIATPHAATRDRTYQWGVHFRPATSLTFIYANPSAPRSASIRATNADGYTWKAVGADGYVPWTTALPGNHWDVVTLQSWQDDSKATMETDTAAFNGMIAAARTRADNASTRFYVYAAWPAVKYDDFDSYSIAFLAHTPNDPTALAAPTRDYFRHLVDSVRRTNPDVEMIPAGEVLYALDRKMRAGRFEHFTSVQQLHRDVIHLNSIGKNVAAWTAYATIFKKSPVGLPNHIHADKDYPPFKNVTDISPADLRVMQETVWEVVTSSELRDYTNAR